MTSRRRIPLGAPIVAGSRYCGQVHCVNKNMVTKAEALLKEDPSPSTAELPQAAEAGRHELFIERVSLLYQRAGIGLLLTLALSLVLGFGIVETPRSSPTQGWLTYMLVTTALRSLNVIWFLRDDSWAKRPAYWRNLYGLGTVLSGIGWGLAAVLFFDVGNLAQQQLLIAVTIGASAGAVLVLAPMLGIGLAFQIAATTPLVWQLLRLPSFDQQLVGIAGLVWLVFVLFITWVTNRHLIEALKLRLENADLAEYYRDAMARVERLNIGLSGEVAERLKTEEQLQRAKDAAEQASQAKGAFLAMVSHEIRTPMNGVLGTLELLRDSEMEEDQHEMVTTAYSSAAALLRIIDDVLDFSKIESGKLNLENIEFDLRRLVREVADLWRKTTEQKGIDISWQVADNLPDKVVGDPTRIRQILMNLVGNAVKFTDQGHVLLRALLIRASQTSLLLRCEIEDTGIGIASEAQERLFQPFSQGDSTTTRRFGGTGLGLSIARQLTNLMGGSIGVSSEPGKGSTFWFTARLGRSSHDRLAHTMLTEPRVMFVGPPSPHKPALLRVVRRLSISHDSALTGADAVDKLASALQVGHSWSFEAVIIDSSIGIQEAQAIAHAIRSDTRLIGTAVIYVDRQADTDDDKVPGGVYFDEVLTPASIDRDLTHVLRLAASQRRQSSSIAGKFGARQADVSEIAHLDMPEPEPEPEIPAPIAAPGLDADTCGRVLLAEDNPVNQQVAMGMLKSLGYSVEVASDGAEAVQALLRQPFDIVLMDMQMPNIDGYEATKLVRIMSNGVLPQHPAIRWPEEVPQHLLARRVPIIAMTANAMDGDRSACLAAGMDDYLSKPVKRAIMGEILEKWAPGTARETEEDGGQPRRPAPLNTVDTSGIDAMNSEELRILLVDDDPDIRMLVKAIVEKLGYAVVTANDGAAAIKIADEVEFDAILMDCQMPEVDGFEATGTIRLAEAETYSRHVPIIALTGNVSPKDRQRCLAAGMDDHLAKPIKPPALRDMLGKWVGVLPGEDIEGHTMNNNNAASGAEPLELDTLTELREIIGDQLDQVIKTYLDNAPRLLHAIGDGIRKNDATAVYQAAHSLKSSSGNLGGTGLQALAMELEMKGRGGDLDGSAKLLTTAIYEFGRVKAALEKL